MATRQVAPTGVEHAFGPDEIIVSKTDLRGRITYANDVFLRMCARPEHEVLGQPHNLIRHPDMPRAIFKLLWETIQAGDEIFAYVLNLAADGSQYWVLAHVTPSFGRSGEITGYHSNRRAPSRHAVDAIRPLYATLLAEERRHTHPVEAIAASTALLQEQLDLRDTTYDQFVWSLTNAGVAA